MRCSEAFQGNENYAKHPRNVRSHVGTPKNVLGENMTKPGIVKKMSQKQPKYMLSDFTGPDLQTPRDAS